MALAGLRRDKLTDADGTVDRPVVTVKEHLITCALATWMLFGLYIDGWAHRSIDLEDSITTPWHAIFYAGWISFASWLFWLVYREMRKGKSGRAAIPLGYGPGVVGVLIWMTGGIGDQFWHLSWGVEQDLNAFFSPTHWGLAIGMFLMVSSPFRAGWHGPGTTTPTMREFAPWLWSLLLSTVMAGFTVNYLSTWVSDLPHVEPAFLDALGDDVDREFAFFTIERLRSLFVATILLSTMLLMGAALHAVRRWKLPAGSLTIVFTGTALAVNGVWEFPFGWVVLASVVGGALADYLVHRLDPRPGRIPAYRLFAGIVPIVMWLTYFLIMEVAYGVNLPAELWSGSSLMATLISLMLSYLMVPSPAQVLVEDPR